MLILGDADRQLAVAPFEIIIKRSIYLSEVQLFSFQLRYSSIAEAKNALNVLNYFNLLYHAACTVPVLPEVDYLFCKISLVFKNPKLWCCI